MNEKEKVEIEVKERFKRNLQIFIAVGTVVGMVIGVLNFFILTAISPIERRVVAIEDEVVKGEVLIERFIIVEEKVGQMADDLNEINENLKEIARAHSIILK